MGSNSANIKPGTWQPSTVLTVTFMIQAHLLCWISDPKMLFERKPFIWSSLLSINLFQNTLRIYQHWPSLLCITMEWDCWWLKGISQQICFKLRINNWHRNIWVVYVFSTASLYSCLVHVYLNAFIHWYTCTCAHSQKMRVQIAILTKTTEANN